MKHLDLISDNEIIDRVTCVYADNRSGECPVIKIKTINIGGIEVKDIKCTVQENGESSLLLGQSVLKQLGEISIDYNNNQLKIRR
jgi:predicted aspartyl protease